LPFAPYLANLSLSRRAKRVRVVRDVSPAAVEDENGAANTPLDAEDEAMQVDQEGVQDDEAFDIEGSPCDSERDVGGDNYDREDSFM
jgi:GTP cyclohydrolase III